jgi:hypothetical protein
MSKRQSKEMSKVCKHISRIMGDDSTSSHVIREIQDWSLKSGPEWTVKRLKALKQSVINYLAFQLDKPEQDRKFNCPEWVAKSHDGFPKGHLGALIRRELAPYSERKVSRLLGVLNVYTAFISNEVTRSQKEKFLKAIAAPAAKDFDKTASEMWQIFHPHLQEMLPKWKHTFLENYNESFNFGGLNTSKPTLSQWKHRMARWHPWTISLIESTMRTGPWTPILSKMGVPVIDGAPVTDHMGHITVLQEKGYKARVIAMPIAGIQVALQPLHHALAVVLKRLRADCTHNQQEGVAFAKDALLAGKTVHAVDLSSATDNFPLAYQLELLKSLGYEHVREFQQICRSKWTSDFGDLTYTKGQPMGMYGSFSLFALAHHSLLIGIEGRLGVNNTYRILGDDIIISDSRVHQVYLAALKKMDIPVSMDKCLDSDLLTEFAGKLITPYGVLPTVKVPTNSSNVIGVQSFINYARVTGSLNHITSVPKKYREFASHLASLPDRFGGAGINPEGLSLIDRLTRFIESSERTIPEVQDLGLTLKEIAFSGNPWVKKVCTFINDQLIEVDQEIDRKLDQEIGPGLSKLYDSQAKRSLLLQVLQSKDLDNTLVFKGAVARKGDVNPSVFREWKLASESAEQTVTKTFDNAAILEDNDKETIVPEEKKRQVRDNFPTPPKKSKRGPEQTKPSWEFGTP